MTIKEALIAVALLLVAGLGFAPQARADEWNQKIKFTFDQPVAIPGKVLPAGTYWFELLNSDSDRNTVEIFGRNGERLYAIEQTAAAFRPAATNNVEVRFAERPHDQPEALLTWYYPGVLYGHQFIYSPRTEKMLARDMRQEVLVSPRGSVIVPSSEAAG